MIRIAAPCAMNPPTLASVGAYYMIAAATK